MDVRPMEHKDVATVFAIATASPETAAWSQEAYETFLARPALGSCWVAEQQSQVVGFVCFRILAGEAELLNLAVLADFRRQGVGSCLLVVALRQAVEAGATKIFLEVRDSNVAALHLYERFGFSQCGRRAGYYTNPPADALILSRQLEGSLIEKR